MTVDLSLGEFSALVAKALRGVGYAWGVTNDGAHSTLVLAQNRLPAGDIVVRLLAEIEHHGVAAVGLSGESTGQSSLCPISLGAALADLGPDALARAPSLLGTRMVLEPLLLAPFLSSSEMSWDGGQLTRNHHGIHLEGMAPHGAVAIELKPLAAVPGPATDRRTGTATRAAVTSATYATLLTYASRTYAPATEASRNTGAG